MKIPRLYAENSLEVRPVYETKNFTAIFFSRVPDVRQRLTLSGLAVLRGRGTVCRDVVLANLARLEGKR